MNKRSKMWAAAAEFALVLSICTQSVSAQDLGYQGGGSGYAAILQNQIVVTTTVPTS